MPSRSHDTRPPAASSRWDPRRVAMGASLLVSLLMLLGKLGAYALTGSAAIFADAAESVIHVLATAFVGFSLWYADQPPDAGHPYGHGKIAYFSAGFEGAMIFAAACSIVYTSVRALLEGPQLEQLGAGLFIIAGLCLVNLVLGLFLIRTGRRYNNLVLVANGRHVLTDMWTSLGVLVGIGLVWLTGLVWLDPFVALLVAANVVWTAIRLMRQAFAGLMEQADQAATQAILHELEQAVQDGLVSGYHQVRHRRVGGQVWVEYHLQLPGDLDLTEAHDRSHTVEHALDALFPDDQVFVTAHLEPDAHDEAHPEDHAEPDDPLRQIDLFS